MPRVLSLNVKSSSASHLHVTHLDGLVFESKATRRGAVKVFSALRDERVLTEVCSLFVRCSAVSTGDTRGSQKCSLYLPRHRLTVTQSRSFAYRAALARNRLPLTTRTATTMTAFKTDISHVPTYKCFITVNIFGVTLCLSRFCLFYTIL